MSLFAMYGVTFFLRDSELFHPVRRRLVVVEFFRKLFLCAYCTGFYSGLFVFVLAHTLPSPGSAVFVYASSALVYAFSGMAFSGVLDALALKLESLHLE